MYPGLPLGLPTQLGFLAGKKAGLGMRLLYMYIAGLGMRLLYMYIAGLGMRLLYMYMAGLGMRLLYMHWLAWV